jgi:hypothetical protein
LRSLLREQMRLNGLHRPALFECCAHILLYTQEGGPASLRPERLALLLCPLSLLCTGIGHRTFPTRRLSWIVPARDDAVPKLV